MRDRAHIGTHVAVHMLLAGTLLIVHARPVRNVYTHLHVRDINTGLLMHTLAHAHPVADMVLVPPPMRTFGSGMLVTADYAAHVWLWDVRTGEH